MSCKVIDIHSQQAYLNPMIHCICNNINTASVDHAAQCGAKTAGCVQRFCGTEFNCGACESSIEDRLALLDAQPKVILQAAE